MYLIWFLTIGTLFSTLFGEFGKYPFASPSSSISITDIFLSLTIGFLLIWEIGIKKRIQIPFPFKLMLVFWGIGVVSLLFSTHISGGLYLLRFILYSSSFWLGYLLIKSAPERLDAILSIIISLGIGIGILGFLQLIVFPDFAPLTAYGYDPHQFRLSSSFLDPNFAGAFLAISFILSIFRYLQKKERNMLLASLFLALAIVFTFSRSAYLMVVSMLFVFGLFRYRKILLVLVVVVAFLFLFVPRFSDRIKGGFLVDASASERISSWQVGMTVFYHEPVLGVGFDNIRQAYQQYNLLKTYSANGGHSGAGVDSSLILVLATTGIVGFISFLSFWGYILYSGVINLFNRENQMMFVLVVVLLGIFIDSEFINSLFFPAIMLITFLLTGAIWGEYSTKRMKLKDQKK